MAIDTLDSNWSNASSNAEAQLLGWLNTSLFYSFFNNLKLIGFNVTPLDENHIDVINNNIKLVNTYLETIVNIRSRINNLTIPVQNETSANNIITNLNNLVKDPDGVGELTPLYIIFNQNINTAISNITSGISGQNYPALIKSFDQWIQLSNNSNSVQTLKNLTPSDPTLLIVKNTIEFNNPNNTLISLFETTVQSKVSDTKDLFNAPLETLKVTYDLLASLEELE